MKSKHSKNFFNYDRQDSLMYSHDSEFPKAMDRSASPERLQNMSHDKNYDSHQNLTCKVDHLGDIAE